MTIIEDTRQKAGKHDIKHECFEKAGVSVVRCMLPFGDYAPVPPISIDTKENITGNYQEALDYVFTKEEIDSVMIGFGKLSEVDDLLSYLDGSMDKSYNPDISKKKVYINQEDCEGCGACKAACPAGAIFYNENGLAEVDHEKCLTCGYCSPVCPVRAVIMY